MEGPRVFISYSHDSHEHCDNVLGFTQELRKEGIDAWIDKFDEARPPISWPQWMIEQIDRANFVLLVVTESYARRFERREARGAGLGVRWEGAVITSDLYHAEGNQVKFIPVVVDQADARFIPRPLTLTSRYEIGIPGDRDLEPLIRHLLGRPTAIPAPLGISRLDEPGRDSAAETEVLEASRLATAGNRTEAIDRLKGLVGNPDHRIAAHAAYALGYIYQKDSLFTNAISAYQRALDFGPLTGVAEDAARNLQLTIASMQAHYGEGSVTDAAHQWLEDIKRGRMEDVWKGVDRTTRLVLAQAWIVANENHPVLDGIDRDFLAHELAKAEPTHELTAAFFATQLDELQDSYSAYDPETWGAAERPRPYGVDYEAVILAETSGEPFMWEDGQELHAIFLLLRRRLTRWYIASFRAEILNPGWPPTATPIDIPNTTWRVANN